MGSRMLGLQALSQWTWTRKKELVVRWHAEPSAHVNSSSNSRTCTIELQPYGVKWHEQTAKIEDLGQTPNSLSQLLSERLRKNEMCPRTRTSTHSDRQGTDAESWSVQVSKVHSSQRTRSLARGSHAACINGLGQGFDVTGSDMRICGSMPEVLDVIPLFRRECVVGIIFPDNMSRKLPVRLI